MAAIVVKRILMVAFHFPPVFGSSGVQRTLKFARYLPEHDWQPLVLTVQPRAYERSTPGQLREIPEGTVVRRAFALDASRHLAVRGAYPGFLALPDRWASWWLGAVPAGLGMIRRYRPRLIWSTYPIASAHLIGYTLHRLSGLPWVADFRDSMTEPGYPSDAKVRRVYQWIEGRAMRHARCAVFTTPGALDMYAERYAGRTTAKLSIIENGYDEENFAEVQGAMPASAAFERPLVLVHSGLLYPSERDPRAFFSALESLRRAGQITAASLRIVLRASGSDDYYRTLIARHGLQDIVRLEPSVSYAEALSEMLAADGLLVFQASNCNHQIPAKVYEYLRARRPILALTDPRGDTARLLVSAGIDTIVPLGSKGEIETGLREFLRRIRSGTAPVGTEAEVRRHSRQARTAELAAILDGMINATGDGAKAGISGT